MNFSLSIFGKELFGLSTTKTLSPDISAFLSGTDSADDSSNAGAKLVHPYAQSAWVYIAVSVLAQNIAQIPFRICRVPASASRDLLRAGPRDVPARSKSLNYLALRRRAMQENVIESGPVVDLFNAPHPTMPRALFWEMVMTYQSLRGEFFIIPLDDSDNPVSIAGGSGILGRGAGKVRRMLTLEPLLFYHMVHGYSLAAWRYTGSPLLTPLPSEVLDPSEVVQSRMPNPYLYWRGMSPMNPAWVTVQSDYAAEQFMKGLMVNNADTGLIVTTDQQVSETQRDAILAALRERKRKAGTADRPLFLWGGAKVDKPAVSSADREFLETRALNRKEIFAIFQVPEALVGFSDRKESLGGGGGAEQERFAFAENTLAPHCTRLEDAVRPIIKTFGADLDGFFDIDSLPIMQEARRGRLDSGAKAFGMGVPFNIIDQLYDLGFGEIEGGDTGYLPFNLQPIEKALAPEPAPGTDNPSDPNSPDSGPISEPSDPNQNHVSRALKLFSSLSSTKVARPALRGALPHTCAPNPEYEAALAPRIKQLRSKLGRFWFEQRNRILAKLPEVLKEFTFIPSDPSDPSDKSESWSFTPRSITSRGIDDLFDHKSENARLMKALRPILLSDLEAGGKQIYREIGATKGSAARAASSESDPSDPSHKSDFSLSPTAAADYLSRAEKLISDINETTWNRLRAELQSGLSSGDSMDQLADRVKTFFAGQDARGDTIALTETNRATNAGRMEGMKDANVERKGWKTSHLENTRATHLENEQLSNEENGIPIDDDWPNGCSYPGDPDAEPGETINCRCFGYAILTAPNS